MRNVKGLSKKEKDFWKFIEKFDYVGLSETWVEEKSWEKLKKRLPERYTWECQYT